MSSFKNLSTAKSAVYAKNGDIWYDVNAKVFKAKANNAIFVLGQSIIDETVLQQINDNIELKLNKDNSNALYSAADSNFTKIELVNPINNAKALFNFDDIATVNYVNSQISQALSAFQDNRLEFNTFDDFPDAGDTTKFYVDLQEDKVYIWDDSSGAYKLQTWDTAAISALQASIANLETTKLNKGTYVGTASDLKALVDTKISGSGTANYIPKFSATGTIGNSIIYDNGTNVGIGTPAPNSTDRIHVFSSTSKSSIRLQSTHSTSSAEINFQSVGGSGKFELDYAGNMVFRTSQSGLFFDNFSATGSINFRTGGANTRMTIDKDGNTGIGTTSPSEKLDIAGRTKSDGQVFNETTSAILPKEIKFKGGKFKAALADGVEKAVLLEGDVHNNILRNFQSNNINYCGFAPFGSAENAAVWTVTKITVAANGTINKETFTNVTWSSVPF